MHPMRWQYRKTSKALRLLVLRVLKTWSSEGLHKSAQEIYAGARALKPENFCICCGKPLPWNRPISAVMDAAQMYEVVPRPLSIQDTQTILARLRNGVGVLMQSGPGLNGCLTPGPEVLPVGSSMVQWPHPPRVCPHSPHPKCSCLWRPPLAASRRSTDWRCAFKCYCGHSPGPGQGKVRYKMAGNKR